MNPSINEQPFLESLHELIHVIMRNSMRHLMRFAKQKNISIAQINILFRLCHKGQCGVSDLGEDLNISNAAVSQLLEKLVQQGLVERTEDPVDRRNKRIVITPLGERLVEESLQVQLRWLDSIAKQFTPEEQTQLTQAVQLLLQKISLQVEIKTNSAERTGRCSHSRTPNL